jgi:competence protein ComEC
MQMKHIKQNLKIYFLLVLIIINALIFYSVYYLSDANLTVAFLDVGQGDAIFVKAPGGHQMLVDGGPNGSVLRELGKVMPFYDRSIDVLVATHADQDHIGGLVEVLKRFKVDLFVETYATSTSAVYLELENLIKEKKIREEIITSPEILTLGGAAEFDILFPTQNTAGWDTNDSSIVGKLIYGSNSFLLTGDSPQAIEKYLAGKYGTFLKSDVLKVGHHGSKNSSSEIFVGTVSPIYSVISVGLNNRYGHPSPEVVNVLNQFGSQILKTLGQGMIVFKSDGQNLMIIK